MAAWPGFNDLVTVNPNLAKEWHPTKNGDLTPLKVTFRSGRKVWWLLPYDDPITGKHFEFEWQATIDSRSRNGCPYLSGKAVWPGFNDLTTVSPKLASEWSHSKNRDILPNRVTINSQKKVWWICPSCGNEWMARIADRSMKGSGCPCCRHHI